MVSSSKFEWRLRNSAPLFIPKATLKKNILEVSTARASFSNLPIVKNTKIFPFFHISTLLGSMRTHKSPFYVVAALSIFAREILHVSHFTAARPPLEKDQNVELQSMWFEAIWDDANGQPQVPNWCQLSGKVGIDKGWSQNVSFYNPKFPFFALKKSFVLVNNVKTRTQ